MLTSKPSLRKQSIARKVNRLRGFSREFLYAAHFEHAIVFTHDLDAINKLRLLTSLAREVAGTEGPIFKLDYQIDLESKFAYVVPVSYTLKNLFQILRKSNLERIWEHLPFNVYNPWAKLLSDCFYTDDLSESIIAELCDKPLLDVITAEKVFKRLNDACEIMRKESKTNDFTIRQKAWGRVINKNKSSLKSHFSELLEVHKSFVVCCASLGYGVDPYDNTEVHDTTITEIEQHRTRFLNLIKRDILLKNVLLGHVSKITHAKLKGFSFLWLFYFKKEQPNMIETVRQKIDNLWYGTALNTYEKTIKTEDVKITPRSLPGLFLSDALTVSFDSTSKDEMNAFIDELVEWDDVTHIDTNKVSRSYRKTNSRPNKKLK